MSVHIAAPKDPSMPSLRIAHITDLHFREHLPGTSTVVARRSREVLPKLHEALGRCQTEKVDFIAVTGDLLDVPHWFLDGDDYYTYPVRETERDALKDYRLLHNLLTRTGIPFMAVPGNHDVPRLFFKAFGNGPWKRDLKGFDFYGFPDREWFGHQARRLDRERQRWLQSLKADPERPQVHLQHYLISPEDNQGYPHAYFEAAHLHRLQVESGRHALILQGHLHRGSPTTAHGNAWYSTGRSFSEAPHPWALHDLDFDGHLLTVTTREITAAPDGKNGPAVFLDRDGVVNTLPSYHTGPEAMKLIPGSAKAIARLRRAGYRVVVITSQSCIGQGYVVGDHLGAVQDRMAHLLRKEGGPMARLDAFFHSQGAGSKAVHPKWENTDNAKPSPKLIEEARAFLNISREGCWMVGDRLTDLEAGRAGACRSVLVETGAGGEEKQRHTGDEPVVRDLAAAADLILETRKEGS